MAMDNTTLHTFLFHCPAALRSIVLLGSWDNFSRPYPLELDTRAGRNIWKGCFTFSEIICDGDLDQPVPKRDGLLKMGGTYWYYYKVDGDEECHNPSEESTTFCPLLPGQRLNVLEMPHEGHSRSQSNNSSSAFTRNPKDRYLTPVPPASQNPLPSPRTGASSTSYSLPVPSPWAPRSATYPPMEGFLSPNVARHARSASASPRMPSTPIFPDFKVLKEKLASKRAHTRNRSGSRELDISSPVHVSGGEDLNLIPLSVLRPSMESTREVPPVTIPASRPVPTIRREFSPLASHPVDPDHDALFGPAELSATEDRSTEQRPTRRRRSHVPSTVITSEFKLGLGLGRVRANSADTRRTQHYLFSNDPWLTSPKMQCFDDEKQVVEEDVQEKQVVEDDTPPAPTLMRPSCLGLPTTEERPRSSHGNSRSPSLRQAALDKELPALPRYLVPAPLYACNNPTAAELPAELSEEADEDTYPEHLDTFASPVLGQKARSHFSTWSADSIVYSPTSSDDDYEPITSPTFSSFTSSDSDIETPGTQGLLISYSYANPSLIDVSKQRPSLHNTNTNTEPEPETYFSTAPQLNELRISTFGSDIFSLDSPEPKMDDAASSRRSSRRQAACFGLGLGFQYSLPEEQVGSKSTLGDVGEPRICGNRGSEAQRLVDEFAFLGDVVV